MFVIRSFLLVCDTLWFMCCFDTQQFIALSSDIMIYDGKAQDFVKEDELIEPDSVIEERQRVAAIGLGNRDVAAGGGTLDADVDDDIQSSSPSDDDDDDDDDDDMNWD